MLVNVIKLMELPEHVIPTLVRLERVDSFDNFGAHTLYFSSLVPFVSSKILRDRTTQHADWALRQSQPERVRLQGDRVHSLGYE